jgi:hypothetical protein
LLLWRPCNKWNEMSELIVTTQKFAVVLIPEVPFSNPGSTGVQIICDFVRLHQPLAFILDYDESATYQIFSPHRAVNTLCRCCNKADDINITLHWGAFANNCRVKAINITYLLCVRACARVLPPFSSIQRFWTILWGHLWRLWLHHIFRHCLIKGTFFGKKFLNIKCVFWFSLHVFLKHFSF